MEKQPEKITIVLKELLELKRIDTSKLAELTDVPQRFIDSLVKGDFSQLPSEPYVRGYLFKIAGVLNADPHSLWRTYRETAELSSSGEDDRLPINRFAIKKVSLGRLLIILLIILLIGFIGLRLNSILGKPTLEVSVPETTHSDLLKVNGQVNPGDRLTLNNETIYPNQKGEFEKEVQLEPGLNTLDFRIKRNLGRETQVIKRVFYQPQ